MYSFGWGQFGATSLVFSPVSCIFSSDRDSRLAMASLPPSLGYSLQGISGLETPRIGSHRNGFSLWTCACRPRARTVHPA